MLKIDQSKNHNFPKSKQAWASYINNCMTSQLRAREALEAEWARNIAYFLGFQHLLYDQKLNVLEIDPNDSEYIINRIAPFVEQRAAKLTRSRPILAVLPTSLDDTTIKAAQLSEMLLKHLHKVLREDEKLDYGVLLAILMGSFFKKITWDSGGGEPILDDQDSKGQIEFDENTGRQKKSLIFLGEIETCILSPFEILVSNGARDICDASWVLERKVIPALEVKKRFPDVDIDRLNKTTSDLTRYEKFVNNLGSPLFGSSPKPASFSNDIKENELVILEEFWQYPNTIYEGGVLATVGGDQLLQFEKWEYDHKKYPYVKTDYQRSPFGFYGIPPVTRLIPIQKHYNEARTQIAKNARYNANIKWWVAKGSGLHDNALTDEQDEVLETNPGFEKPQQIGVTPLPNYVIENQLQDINDFRDIGGERAVDQKPFSSLTAGVAIETMAELSDIGLGPALKNIERGMVYEGHLKLMLANQLYTDERILKIAGPQTGDLLIKKFKASDLLNQTDVTIQLESALGHTRAVAQQKLLDLWDRRIIIDPQKFMKAYVTGDLDIILKEKNPAENVVIEQIEMIKQGANPVVSPFDNHIVHATMLVDWISSPEFRRMPGDRQLLATQTLQQHMAFLGMGAQQQAPEQNQAAVNTPFGQQVPEGT